MMLFRFGVHLHRVRVDEVFIDSPELLILLLLLLPVLFHLIFMVPKNPLHVKTLLVESGSHLHVFAEKLGIEVVLGESHLSLFFVQKRSKFFFFSF